MDHSAIFAAILCVCCATAAAQNLEVVNQWSFLEFDFPYDYEIINMYRPDNTLFTGLEIMRDRIFLAMPRLRVGIPATLATIPRHTPPGSGPVLQAYPDWSFHQAGRGIVNCTGLMSVYRMRTDACGRLWVLDSGVMTSLDDFRRVCEPKIVIFDTRTDTVARTVIFPREVLRPASLFTNLIVDESLGQCDNAVVYITDTAAPGIVVYDSRADRAWRFMHPSMFADPDFSNYNIQGETFSLMDGIVGLGHSANLGQLYFQPLATDRLFSVPTEVLRRGPLPEFEELPVALVGRKSSQGLGIAVDPRDDTIIFSPLTETAIASWQPGTNEQRVLAYDPVRLQFPSEIRIADQDGYNIWALTTRFQKFFKRQANAQEINLRIVRIRTAPQHGRLPLRGVPLVPGLQGYNNNTLF